MVGILFSVLFGILAYFFSKVIRKRFNIILGFTVVLSAVSFFLDFELSTQGFLGLGFFVVVMYAGAFSKGSTVNKRLRSVRKEYSILGFIVLLPHAISYLLEFLEGSYPVEWFGIIAYAIMIPLFTISFQYFKKKMPIKKWIQIQKFAYLVYASIFIHLLVIGESEHLIVYILLFSFYTFLKLKNDVFKENSKILRVAKSSGISLIIILGSLMYIGTINVSSLFETASVTETSILTLEDGTYFGTGSGFKNLPVSVDVEIISGEITSIIVYEYGATSSHGGVNFVELGDEFIENILATQDTTVDAISGASKTSEGLREAILDALS